MIAGLPWTAWLLLLCALAPGLSLSLLFLVAHAGETSGDRDSGRGVDRAAEAEP